MKYTTLIKRTLIVVATAITAIIVILLIIGIFSKTTMKEVEIQNIKSEYRR